MIDVTDFLTRTVRDEDAEGLREHAARALSRARERSTALTDAVDDEDLVRQHSKLMSPLVWDLAHIGSQEELWLVRDVGGRAPLRPEIDGLYDAFRHSRASRVQLPLLTPSETRAYVAQVRDKALDVLERSPLRGRRLVEAGFAFGMIVQHEQQHDETMLATHQLRAGDPVLSAPPPPRGRLLATRDVLVPAGPFTMWTSAEPWALECSRSEPSRTATCAPGTPSRSRRNPIQRAAVPAAVVTICAVRVGALTGSP